MARTQEVYDYYEHTLHGVANYVLLRGKRQDTVHVLDPDGPKYRLLGGPVFGVRWRGVRSQVQGYSHGGHERVLLRRFVNIYVDLCGHHELEADRTHLYVGARHKHHRPIHGNCTAKPKPFQYLNPNLTLSGKRHVYNYENIMFYNIDTTFSHVVVDKGQIGKGTEDAQQVERLGVPRKMFQRVQ